jgi:hypothetical protein
MTATLERSFIFNQEGQPQGVIIPWLDYVEIAETLGWDFTPVEVSQLREALHDSAQRNVEAFVAIDDL